MAHCDAPFLLSRTVMPEFPDSKRPSALNDAYQHHNNGNDEQNMDQAAHGIGSNDSQQPEHDQDHADCPQHLYPPPDCLPSGAQIPCRANIVKDLIKLKKPAAAGFFNLL
jgi:hypothetical protein